MIELINKVQELYGEVKLLRYRLQQLESLTKIGVILYAILVVVIIPMIMYLIFLVR